MYLATKHMKMPEEKPPTMPGERVPPPPPQKKGLFGSKSAPPGPGPEIAGMTQQINNLAARIRISEERFSELRKKLNFIEQNMLQNHKKAMTDVKMLTEEITDMKGTMGNMEERIITIIKELRLTARKDDISVLKRYIELWDPVKFITADQAEKIAQEILAGEGLVPEPSPPEEEGENI